MDTVPLERQDYLMQVLEDCLVSWTTHDLRQKRMSVAERNWMFEYVTRRLGLPNFSMLTNRRLQETNQMAHQATIVQKLNDQTVPTEFVDIAAGTNDGYIGYAFVEDGELSYGNLDTDGDAIKTVTETMEEKPSLAMAFVFGKGHSTDESKQPFNTLQDDEGNCICAAFIEGNLQGFGAPESSHSIEFAAHQEYLQAKVIDIFGSTSEDIAKTVEKLNSALVRRELTTTLFPTPDSRGEILLVFANGQTVNIIKGDKHKKYEWGQVSQALSYEGKAVQETLTLPKKNVLGKNKDAAKSTTVKPDTAVSAAMDKATKDASATPTRELTNLKFMITPPANRCQSFKDMEAFYKTYCHPDHLPPEKSIEAAVRKAHLAPGALVKPQITNDAFNKLLKDGKFLLALEQTKGNAPAAKNQVIIPMSIIPNADRESFNKNIMPKIVKAVQNYDDGSRLIVPTEELIKYMKDKPSATQQLGLQEGVSQFYNWSQIALEELATKMPLVAASLIGQLLLEHMQMSTAVSSATKIQKAM